MSSEFLDAFIAEARLYLDQIRYSLISYETENEKEQLQKALDCSAKINAAIPIVGLSDLVNLLASFHENLVDLISNPSTSKVKQLLLELQSIESEIDNAKLSSEVIDLESVEEFEQSNETFEVDQEMLEIFLSEAEEHFQNISRNIELLKTDKHNKVALSEIRRSFHTLKGSAGIVGLKNMSELAHRIEDLLDYLVQNPEKIEETTFQLLSTALTCLEIMSYSESHSQIDEKLQEIENQISLLKQETLKQEPVKDSVAGGSDTYKIPADLTTQQQIPQEAPRAVIRVSIERLDELARLADEITILSSFFENQLSKLKQQVDELRYNSLRFARLSSKIDTDFGSLERTADLIRNNDLPQRDFDALEFDRYTEFHQTSLELSETASDTNTISDELLSISRDISLTFNSQQKLVKDIRDKLLRLRMIPFSTLSQRLQRAVQVTADEENKKVELLIENGEVEIDSEIIHLVSEPLLHLLRNAISHGIEKPEIRRALGKPEYGRIKVSVHLEDNHVVFYVEDDGQGILIEKLKEKALQMKLLSPEEIAKLSDEEALNLIFISGLSTVSELSEIAGRGIGMDVVRACVERFKGNVAVKSAYQKGTIFKLTLPVALSITKVLPVKCGDNLYAFPLKTVRYVTEVTKDKFESAIVEGNLNLREKSYKPVYLDEVFNVQVLRSKEKTVTILLVEEYGDNFAVGVEKILKPEEFVIKPIKGLVAGIDHLIGASMLSDGRVMPVLDLAKLLRTFSPAKPTISSKTNREIVVMIVDDSPSVRKVNEKMITSIGWRAVTAKDGLEAIEILESFIDDLPDVILTDIEMPRMDGYEFISALKRHESFRRIPILVITSRTSDKHKQKAFQLGVSSYITKPFDQRTLIEKVNEVLR
mgnify:CR=1 FL=1